MPNLLPFILSFRASIVRIYNFHSLRLHPKMHFFAEKELFSSLLRSFQRIYFSLEPFRPLHRQLAVQSAHAMFLSIEKYPCCNSRRTAFQTRRGEANFEKFPVAPRLGTLQWESISPYEWPFSIFTLQDFHPIYCKEHEHNLRSSGFASLSWRYFPTRRAEEDIF